MRTSASFELDPNVQPFSLATMHHQRLLPLQQNLLIRTECLIASVYNSHHQSVLENTSISKLHRIIYQTDDVPLQLSELSRNRAYRCGAENPTHKESHLLWRRYGFAEVGRSPWFYHCFAQATTSICLSKALKLWRTNPEASRELTSRERADQ